MPPTTATTAKPNAPLWSERTIASTGHAQDIAPALDGVYWLNVVDQNFTPSVVQPIRYDPTTGQMTKGPSISGFIVSPALTVTGGWVWVVVGTPSSVVVEQLNPSTLALTSRESLPVKNGVSGEGVVYPVLTATVDGPLWVTGGEDLWALNPSTGAVETEFDAGDEIASMSTDPTGSLLYTGGRTTAEGMTVTEYNAQTGQELLRTDLEVIGPGTVAATNGGVWVSARGGMAGSAVELSADDLKQIAPPASELRGFGTFVQIMGVGSSISEGTLWLTSTAQTPTLTCAEPTTGAIRASESTSVTVEAPIATGPLLYAVTLPGGVVVITPTAKCFG